MSSTQSDPIDRQLIEAHIASGQPRYSIMLKLVGGGYIRRWTNDHDAAVTEHAAAATEPAMVSVITFDHLGLDTVAMTFAEHGKTPQQLKAESDAGIDAMIERWLLETRH